MNQSVQPSARLLAAQNRRVMVVMGIIGLLGLFFFLFSIYFEKIDRMRDYVMVTSALLVFISSLVGIYLVRVGKTELGTWILTAFNLLMSLLVGVILKGMAPSIGSYVFITTLLLTFAGIPPKHQRYSSPVLWIVILAIASVEFWNPAFRGNSPPFVDLGNYFSVGMWTLFVAVITLQIRRRAITVEGRVNWGFMTVVFLLLLSSLMAIRTFRDYNDATDLLVSETRRAQAASELQSTIWRLKESETTIVLSPASVAAGRDNQYTLDRSQLEQSLATWLALMTEQGEDTALVQEFQTDVQVLLGATDQAIELARTNKPSQALLVELNTVKPAVATLTSKLSSVVADAETRRKNAQANLDATIIAGLTRTMFVSLFVLAVGFILSFLVSNSIVTPILELVGVAEALGRGDRSVRGKVAPDEIGVLGETLNNTVTQLDQLYTNLELQVADRTRALEVSSEVSRRLSTILNLDQLVREVVEQLRQAFGYYHVQIYLYDTNYENLVMVGGTGDAGREMLARGHHIARGRGLVGRAAGNNKTILVSDTSRDPGWLPNPLLPNTRSEVALPISVGDNILGVLDVQHDVINGLKEEDANLLQSIANQVAVAIQNARAYARAQFQAEHEMVLADVTQKIQQATSIDDVLQVAVRELGQVLNARRSSVELHNSVLPKNGGSEPVQS